ncbi:probable RNA-binding protein EIF1AD [Ceratitis capitata]|uniref:Probable RNA-binding protein EIF1AD n=1 Tax=Ceratitis capitata TaxID=7213 RepID=W8B231_CERCA|nr:probable RNA-binding protein EIF1AD [Ceratitis capitata]
MSIVLRRKHVLKEMMEDDFESPTKDQQIVRILGSRGNNLHEVETATAERFLVSMPNKFRRNIWVKRGNYVVVENIEEGVKVRGEICKILTPEHVKEYTKAGVWPKEFGNDHEQIDMDSDENGDDLLMRNPNRPTHEDDEDGSCTDEDDDDSSTDDDGDDDSCADQDDDDSSEKSCDEEKKEVIQH